ncbi:adenylate/guanylate cyclase domain-containing protein, partial [Pseudomonas sp. BGM005]|nr:adenylate/guanylate cyclase domain-containing protein [Pseudomonas sp. BG5]
MTDQSLQRRLAAIVVADVVGYSRLMEADEVATLANLRELRSGVIEPAVMRHNGRIFKVVGDGFLIEFGSAVDAVEAALEMQRANTPVEPSGDRRLLLRVGVNLGDVIDDGSDVLGDGVNVAARLETQAAPGGICISAGVHGEIV